MNHNLKTEQVVLSDGSLPDLLREIANVVEVNDFDVLDIVIREMGAVSDHYAAHIYVKES